MDTAAFLKTVVTTDAGYFNLALKSPSDQEWEQEWYEWPLDIEKIIDRAIKSANDKEVYFSAHLFEERLAIKSNVLPSRTVQADLDDAIVPTVNAPSVLVETSPGRHQGFWILRDRQLPVDLEDISRQLTYSIPDSDHSGWSLGHKMRVPGTLNHKYSTGPKVIKVISAVLSQYSNLRLSAAARRLASSDTEGTEGWVPSALSGIGPRELWVQIKPTLPRKVQAQYDIRNSDRSVALWSLMLALFNAGATRDQVFVLAQASANNKFKDNKYHADVDLAKDVLRAERAIQRGDAGAEDIRSKVMDARHLPGLPSERRAYIAALVRDNLGSSGSFVATIDGQEWYVREDTGRPIPLTRSNDYFNSLLEVRYGLNASEPEQRYVINSLISTTKERGQPGRTASLSYYDKAQQIILVHTGRRDVMHVDQHGASIIANGNLNVVFPWRSNEDPFDADLDNPLSLDTLFDGCFDNLNEMAPNEAMALIKAWLYFLFFRDDATGRPILALFGQPGSGKSTLFRRIYTLLYGPGKAINSITTAEDFDHAVANDPLVVFDNVDTWVGWLPDKLALSASTSDLVRRKLYTDSDTVTLKRQALVGLTAHNPKFRREDIVDRLIILSLHRLRVFKPETELLQNIILNRDRLWGGIIKDLSLILSTPQPLEHELPRFRVSDFARIGLWTARALGFETDFVSALERTVHEQTTYNLEEEDILIDTIKIWMTRPSHRPSQFYAVGELWTQWTALSRDPANFIRMYRNAVLLGKKLWSLQETLNSVFEVEFEFEASGARLWRFAPK